MECCQNPWNKKCGNNDIEVYIFLKEERLPICRDCWKEIAEKNLEW